MAFVSKLGNILKQSVSKNINSGLSASNPSIFQAIRCMSSSKLFVGGLSYSTDETSLREAFSNFGQVVEARVIMDRETGRSRGFGFITFPSGEEATKAIQGMDGQDLHGRRVRVNYATDRTGGFRSGGGGGGYGGGGYGGGGDNYGSGGGYGGSGGGGFGGDNFGSGGGGGYGDSGSGYNANAGGGYGDSGSGYNANSGAGYGGGSGYSGGSGNFGVVAGGSDNFASGPPSGESGFASGTSAGYGSGGGFAGGSGNFGVAAGGSDNFASGPPSGEGGYYGGSTGTSFGSSSQYTSEQAGGVAPGGYGQGDALGGNFNDADDASQDLADRRG